MHELLHIPVTFRSGTRLPAGIDDPQVVNQAIASLVGADGELTASDIVDAASDSASPIHAAFEWDDAVCGEKYREGQAFYLAGALVDARTHQRLYVSRYTETNDVADIGRIRINVRMLPPAAESGDAASPQPTSFVVRTTGRSAPVPILVDMPDAAVAQEVVDRTPEDDRALAVFRRWVDAHRHDVGVLRAALRILHETL